LESHKRLYKIKQPLDNLSVEKQKSKVDAILVTLMKAIDHEESLTLSLINTEKAEMKKDFSGLESGTISIEISEKLPREIEQ
jgi:hypothetical protein